MEKEVVKNNIVTVTRTVTLPDGTKDETTTVTDRSTTKHQESTTLVTAIPTLNVSGLVANDFSTGVLKPVYGISVSKQIIGPFTVGGFALTNGTIGVSVGLNF